MWPSPRNPKPGEPRGFYAEADEDSWLKPIWNGGKDIFIYFSNISRAMALSCRGNVYVSKYNLDRCAPYSLVVGYDFPKCLQF
jgi:hypothetical protein